MADTHKQQGQHSGNGAAEVIQHGVAAAWSTGEAAQQVETAGTEAVQQAWAEVLRKAPDTASRGPVVVAEEAQQTVRSLWASSHHLWRTLSGQAAMPGKLPEIPQAFAGLFGDMIRTNLQIRQELFRLANPVAIIEMQQKLMRGYLNRVQFGTHSSAPTPRPAGGAFNR